MKDLSRLREREAYSFAEVEHLLNHIMEDVKESLEQ